MTWRLLQPGEQIHIDLLERGNEPLRVVRRGVKRDNTDLLVWAAVRLGNFTYVYGIDFSELIQVDTKRHVTLQNPSPQWHEFLATEVWTSRL